MVTSAWKISFRIQKHFTPFFLCSTCYSALCIEKLSNTTEQQQKSGRLLKSGREAILRAICHQGRRHEVAGNHEADCSCEIFSSRSSEHVANCEIFAVRYEKQIKAWRSSWWSSIAEPFLTERCLFPSSWRSLEGSRVAGMELQAEAHSMASCPDAFEQLCPCAVCPTQGSDLRIFSIWKAVRKNSSSKTGA